MCLALGGLILILLSERNGWGGDSHNRLCQHLMFSAWEKTAVISNFLEQDGFAVLFFMP